MILRREGHATIGDQPKPALQASSVARAAVT